MTNNIRKEFLNHTLKTILDFINLFSPEPDSRKYKFFNIKTKDGCSLRVWGIDKEEIIVRFRRFLKLYLFI